MAMFKTNVRANNSGQFEGTAYKNVGFRGKRARKFTPTSPPNITMEFHYHAFCALVTILREFVAIFGEYHSNFFGLHYTILFFRN